MIHNLQISISLSADGDTPCVSLRQRDYIFVFEAGSGIRETANEFHLGVTIR